MSAYQSEMKVPMRPAPPPPVNSNLPQISKPLTAWNGTCKLNHSKISMANEKKKPPPRPPPPKFPNSKQDKKPVPVRPSQLITSLFHRKNNSSKGAEELSKPNFDVINSRSNNNVLSLIDFNSPPSSPTFTTRSSSDALSVNSFGSDGITPCSTSSGNTSNVESGFEDDFDFFWGSAKRTDIQLKDPWSLVNHEQTNSSKNTSPLVSQGKQKLNSKSNSWVAFPSPTSSKKNCNDKSAMPTIIRVKPEKPKLLVKEKVIDSVSVSNITMLSGIFEDQHHNLVNVSNSLFQDNDDNGGVGDGGHDDDDDDDGDGDDGDDGDDGWSSESPPMPTCPPPAPPMEVLQSLFENSLEILDARNSRAHGIALYDFKGDHSNDLSFKENDVINLVRRIDGNWFVGELHGREGTVPANFISIRIPLAEDKFSGKERLVTALFSFRAETWDDLEFQEGAVINVLGRINRDWLYGECNGRTGQFPANFVNRTPPDLPSWKK